MNELETEVIYVDETGTEIVTTEMPGTESSTEVPADSQINNADILTELKSIHFDLLIIILLILAIWVFDVMRKSFLRVRGD